MEEGGEKNRNWYGAVFFLIVSLWLWHSKTQIMEDRDTYQERSYAFELKYNTAKLCVEEHSTLNAYQELKSVYYDCF